MPDFSVNAQSLDKNKVDYGIPLRMNYMRSEGKEEWKWLWKDNGMKII